LARRCLANSWNPFWINQIELSHVLKIADGKAATELAGQSGSQVSDEFLAILSAVGSLLLLLEDAAANLVVRIDLKQVNAAGGALTSRQHQTADGFV
jgi:hypothetical protein